MHDLPKTKNGIVAAFEYSSNLSLTEATKRQFHIQGLVRLMVLVRESGRAITLLVKSRVKKFSL